MKETEKKTARLCILNFHNACHALARTVNEHLFDGTRQPYWVAEEVGGICDFGDTDFLTPDDMVLILEYGVSYDDYVEWREANIKYGETKGNINLKSWLRGCRHSMLAEKAKHSNSANIEKK